MTYKDPKHIPVSGDMWKELLKYRAKNETWKKFFERVMLLIRFHWGEIKELEDGRYYDEVAKKVIYV